MKTLSFFATLAISVNAIAQSPILEKSYNLPPEAKNGWLGTVEVNNEKQTIDLTYISPGKDQYEIYTYDKDLNLLKTDKGNDAQKMKSSKNDNSNSYSIASTSINMKCKLLVRKKEVLPINNVYGMLGKQIGFKAPQMILGAIREIIEIGTRPVGIGEKIEVMTNDKQPYCFRGGAYEVRTTNTLLVIAGKPNGEDNVYPLKNFEILSFDKETNMKVVGSLEFPYCNLAVFSAPLKDEQANISNDDMPRDWIVVFAPVGTYGKGIRFIQLDDKDKDPKPTNYTYLRLSPEGKIVDRVSFESPSNGWRITGASEINSSVYLYGSTMTKDPADTYVDKVFGIFHGGGQIAPVNASSELEAHNVNPSMGEIAQRQKEISLDMDVFKYTHFQVGKITNRKLDFISSTSYEDLEKNQVKPTSQKKPVFNEGEKFVSTGIYVSKAGNIFVSGYNFESKYNRKSYMGAGSGGEEDKAKRTYKGLFVFQFDAKGILIKNYGVDLKLKDEAINFKGKYFNESGLEAGDKGTVPERFMPESYLSESADGKILNWTIRSCQEVYGAGGGCIPNFGYGYIAINTSTSELSEYKTLDKPSYFLLNNSAYTEQHGGKSKYLEVFNLENFRKDKPDFVIMNNSKTCVMGNFLYSFNANVEGNKILINRLDVSK